MLSTSFAVCWNILRDRAAKFAATCNQISATCEQLPSEDCPYCAWSIRQDVGQLLRMQEAFSCNCYGALLEREKNRRLGWDMPIYLFLKFPLIQGSLEISSKTLLPCLCNGQKGFTFVKWAYLQCFSAWSEHVISSQRLTILTQFMNFPHSFYHVCMACPSISFSKFRVYGAH